MSIFFAWAEEGEVFDAKLHSRLDMDIFRLSIAQKEWELASLTLEVSNFELPPSTKRYAYISYEKDGGVPLFFGKLVDFPIQAHKGLYKLEFISHIKDFEAQILSFSKSLKKEPYWNENFLNEYDLQNPTSLLEARHELFAWDRVSGKGITSNLFKGRTVWDASEYIFLNNLKIFLKEMPLQSINVQVIADWMQTAGGEVNVGKKIGSHFKRGLINTLSPKQFESGWFKQGRLGQSGYWIVENKLKAIQPQPTGRMKSYSTVSGAFKRDEKTDVRLRRHWYKSEVLLQWMYEQRRRQTAAFTLNQRAQIKDDRKQKTLVLHVQRLNPMPTASYFHTLQGQKDLEYALRVAEAHLACSARCIETEITVPFEEGMKITLDHSVRITNKTIPGGILEGKVTAYKMVVTPTEQYVKIQIASSVGEEVKQNPCVTKERYVEEEYCADKEEGSFEEFTESMPDEGILYPQNLNVHDLVKAVWINGQGDEQEAYLEKNQYPVRQNLKAALKEVPTTIHLDLLDLSADSCLSHTLQLKVRKEWAAPKQIDITKRWF